MSLLHQFLKAIFYRKKSLTFSMNDNYANTYLFSAPKNAKKYLFYAKIYLLK